jgi:hypothetical protein
VLALEARQLTQLLGSADVLRLLFAEVAVFIVLYVFYFALQKICRLRQPQPDRHGGGSGRPFDRRLAAGESVPPFLGLAALGYRDTGQDRLAGQAKVRWPRERFVVEWDGA